MVKFLYTFIILFLCSFLLLPQSRNYTQSEKNSFRQVSIPAGTADTIHYFTGEGVLWFATDGGYVNGTNVYEDQGKYQRFDFNEGINSLTGFVAIFGVKEIVGTADSLDFVVKEVAAGGAPGTTLRSVTISTNEIDTTNFTFIPLSSTLSGVGDSSLFIGFEWTLAVDDTFGLISDDENGGDGANRAWEKWDDGQYHSYTEEVSWELDIDLWIAAIVETTTDVDIVTSSGFSLSQNYPNPFNPNTKITFNLNADSKVVLKIYNLLGEEITTLVDKDFSAGPHFVNFNAANLNSGVYFYELKSEGYNGTINTEVKKMILAK